MEIAFQAILRFAKARVNASQGLMLFDKGDGSSAKTFFWNFEICFFAIVFIVLFCFYKSILHYHFFFSHSSSPPLCLLSSFFFFFFARLQKWWKKLSVEEASMKQVKRQQKGRIIWNGDLLFLIFNLKKLQAYVKEGHERIGTEPFDFQAGAIRAYHWASIKIQNHVEYSYGHFQQCLKRPLIVFEPRKSSTGSEQWHCHYPVR